MNSNTAFLVLFFAIPSLVSSQFCEHLEIQPHPEWCSAVFFCRFGFWTVYVCPNGLMFNHDKRKCDYPENVDCVNDPNLTTPEWSSPTWTTPDSTTLTTPESTTSTTPESTTSATPELTPTHPTDPIDPIDPTDLTTTTTIPPWVTPTTPDIPTTPEWTTPSRPTTPEWTTPSRPTTPEWTTPTRTNRQASAKKSCGDSTQPLTLPHELCEYFYKCIDGIAFEMKCGNILAWDANQELCYYPENVYCVNGYMSQV